MSWIVGDGEVIVVCGGVKGGTGKTTTAVNLGIERARRGCKVLLVDADPDQESLTDYLANRGERGTLPAVNVIQVKGTTTAKSLMALAKDYDDVIVDSGGFDSVELRQAVLVCQVWLVPTNPTQMQVWTMPKLKEVLDGANAMRGDAQLTGHLMGMRLSTNSLNRARQDLDAVAAEYDGFAVLGTVVHQRAAFERAEALGLSVTELEKPSESDRKARDAVVMLHDEVFGASAMSVSAEAASVG
jgi:chromosome partitioning protein